MAKASKYRKKQVVVEAHRLTRKNAGSLAEWCRGWPAMVASDAGQRWVLRVPTDEGVLSASMGDYIVKGVEGEFYPVKPSIFKKTYERWDEE